MKSLLFLPADKTQLFPKALKAAPDCVVLDLEDGVAQEKKQQARDALAAMQADFHGHGSCEVGLRISSLSTPEGLKDMLSLLAFAKLPDWLFLPKCEHAHDLEQVQALLLDHPAGVDLKLCALLETPAGLANAEEIAGAHAPLHALAFGYADYTAETGGGMGWKDLMWPRGQLLNAAVKNHLWALDGVYLDFHDPDGLAEEARNARQLGYNGKIAIHPAQVSVINQCFEPSAEDMKWAQNVIDKQKQAKGKGAFVVDGKMVDAPILLRARRILGLGKEGDKGA